MSIKFRAKTPQGFYVDSPLQPFTFPDGAAHIKGVDSEQEFVFQIADVRGLDHTDLFHLAMWSEAMNTRNYVNVHQRNRQPEKLVLFLPYLPGARADKGSPRGAEVYYEFLAQNVDVDQVITIDPHSEYMPDLWADEPINLLTIFPVARVIKNVIQNGSSDSRPQPYVGVIAPDKGAVKRASQAAKVMGVPVYKAEKTRDFETGKLTGFHMIDELPTEGKLLIVDDIVDGGGTFLGLAKTIGVGPERLDLWVTHGVFSKGLRDFPEYFGTIHTTNSYTNREMLFQQNIADHDIHELVNDLVHIHDITPYLYSAISV